jgi:hypothetical protein
MSSRIPVFKFRAVKVYNALARSAGFRSSFLAIHPLPTSDFQVIDIAASGLGLKVGFPSSGLGRHGANWIRALKGVYQAESISTSLRLR